MTSPNDLMEFAVSLSASSPTELQCRCAASKAYYAVFHKASTLLTDCGLSVFDPASRMSHQDVSSAFECAGSTPHPLSRIAGALTNLKGLRKRADYRLGEAFPTKSAQEALEDALDIGARLDLFRGDDGKVLCSVREQVLRANSAC